MADQSDYLDGPGRVVGDPQFTPPKGSAPTPSPSAEELRRVRAEIGRLVDTRVPALAPKDAYSSKSVGEAVDGIMSLLTTFADARVAEAVERERGKK